MNNIFNISLLTEEDDESHLKIKNCDSNIWLNASEYCFVEETQMYNNMGVLLDDYYLDVVTEYNNKDCELDLLERELATIYENEKEEEEELYKVYGGD